ncbi:MAG: hypothetical protein JWM32_40 [Verrucomicrobia bacterium]|nr:hypothetical protein [Verrucomicrobiota bacterium]
MKKLISFVFRCMFFLAAAGVLSAQAAPDPVVGRPVTLLFDDYYQLERPAGFTEGVPARPEDRARTNFYHPEANAIPNGTFVFFRLIAEDYHVRVSSAPLSAELLRTAGAYMIVCPVSSKKGGRADLTEKEAALLEAFVADGGILILAGNSISDPEKASFDLVGMNRVAARFGLHFAAKTSQTLLVPVARDNPVFSGPRNFIYGNGTIIDCDHPLDPHVTVLVQSSNPEVPGAIAVRVRYKQGTVLVLGDAGTIGNAHALRNETDQPEALRQMMHSLLPDGPLPGYGWKPGTRLQARITHERIASGYPDELRLLDLPRDAASAYVEVGMRALDREAAKAGATPAVRAERGFASATARSTAQVSLRIGESDGLAYAATWSTGRDSELASRLTPRGEVIDSAIGAESLAEWRWALTGEIIMAPLDPAARIGDTWTRRVMVPLASAQLDQAPRLRAATATFRFEGREELKGRACYVVSKSVEVSAPMLPQDLVKPAYADYFNERNIRFTSSSEMVYVKAWIDEASRLPVRTELRATSAFWWSDEDQPDSFISTHDAKRVYETTKATRHVVTIGRLLTAEFESQ